MKNPKIKVLAEAHSFRKTHTQREDCKVGKLAQSGQALNSGQVRGQRWCRRGNTSWVSRQRGVYQARKQPRVPKLRKGQSQGRGHLEMGAQRPLSLFWEIWMVGNFRKAPRFCLGNTRARYRCVLMCTCVYSWMAWSTPTRCSRYHPPLLFLLPNLKLCSCETQCLVGSSSCLLVATLLIIAVNSVALAL